MKEASTTSELGREWIASGMRAEDAPPMSDEVARRFISLKTLRIRIITRMEAMRADGMRYDNEALVANFAETDEHAREHGRRGTDRDDPVHPYLEEPQEAGISMKQHRGLNWQDHRSLSRRRLPLWSRVSVWAGFGAAVLFTATHFLGSSQFLGTVIDPCGDQPSARIASGTVQAQAGA